MENTILKTLKTYIEKEDLGGVIIDSWQNVFYVSGFTGYGDALLLVTRKNQYVFTDSRYTVQVKEECPDFEFTEVYKHNVQAVREKIEKEGLKKLGFEEKAVSCAEYSGFYEKLGVEFKSFSFVFEEMRRIKNADELRKIEKACDIAAKALLETMNYIKPGVKESDVAARLEYEMRLKGAERPAFDTIVASGIRGSMPHGKASEKLIEKGDAVTIDFGAFYGGYCSDCTRTFFVGNPRDKETENIYNIVLRAQRSALYGYKEGMTGFDLDKIARDVIEEAGFGKEFGHATGHGVGIDVHEGVSVSKRSEEKLTDGMVFSVEPGIYREGLGGVRIEDLVTPVNGKLRVMTKEPATDLIIL